jgi:hypothetical protein
MSAQPTPPSGPDETAKPASSSVRGDSVDSSEGSAFGATASAESPVQKLESPNPASALTGGLPAISIHPPKDDAGSEGVTPNPATIQTFAERKRITVRRAVRVAGSAATGTSQPKLWYLNVGAPKAPAPTTEGPKKLRRPVSARMTLFWQRWTEALDPRAPVSVGAHTSGPRQLLREWIFLAERERARERRATRSASEGQVESDAFNGGNSVRKGEERETSLASKRNGGRGSGALQAVEHEAFGLRANNHAKVRGVLEEDSVVMQVAGDLLPAHTSLAEHFAADAPPQEVAWGLVHAATKAAAARLDARYLKGVIDDLRRALFEPTGGPYPLNPERAEKIDGLTTALITDLLGLGFSERRLRALIGLVAIAPSGETVAEDNLEQQESDGFERLARRILEPPSRISVVLRADATSDFWEKWRANLGDEIFTSRENGRLARAPRSEFEITGVSQLAADILPKSVEINGQFKAREERDSTTSASEAMQRLTSAWHRQRADSAPDFANPAGGNSRYVRVDILSAYDEWAAAKTAHLEFERLGDLLCAELTANDSPQVNAVGVVPPETPNSLIVDHAEQAGLRPVHRRRSARDNARQSLGFAKRVLGGQAVETAQNRIAGALRQSRLSMTERWTESSMTTLWTALEVLAHEDYSGIIIEKVVRSVTPFLGAVKVRDLTDDLVAYLRYANIGSLDAEKYRSILGDAISGGDDPLEVNPHRFLRKMSDAANAQELMILATPSPLLAFRIERFHKAVKTGKDLADRIERSMRRAEWQVRRVYRIRNDIIHGAAAGTNSERMLEHLQVYVAAMLDPLSKLLGPGTGLETIEEAVSAVDGTTRTWLRWIRDLGPLSTLREEDAERVYHPPFEALCRQQ